MQEFKQDVNETDAEERAAIFEEKAAKYQQKWVLAEDMLMTEQFMAKKQAEKMSKQEETIKKL
ncbi:hypothetical protein, partial [Bacillus velezensis]|uniref:hypothetical protein n=1 Tax=Bacillus velezensis TaxID=492670 RepID=UPI000BA66FB4